MTVKQLTDTLSFTALSLPRSDREIDGVYIGDLLSWVMGRASSDNVWVTIMSNINVIAVAALADVSCVILAEGVSVDDDVLSAAREKGINLLSSPDSIFQIAVELSAVI